MAIGGEYVREGYSYVDTMVESTQGRKAARETGYKVSEGFLDNESREVLKKMIQRESTLREGELWWVDKTRLVLTPTIRGA